MIKKLKRQRVLEKNVFIHIYPTMSCHYCWVFPFLFVVGGGGRKETKCLLVGNFGFYVKHLGIRMGDFSFIQVNDGCLVKSCWLLMVNLQKAETLEKVSHEFFLWFQIASIFLLGCHSYISAGYSHHLIPFFHQCRISHFSEDRTRRGFSQQFSWFWLRVLEDA